MRKLGIAAAPLGFIVTLLSAAPAMAQSSSSDAADAAAGLFGLGISGAFLCCYALILLVLVAIFVFWIFMLVDCIQRDVTQFPGGGENAKTVWIVVLLVSLFFSLYWLAAIIYYFMVKRAMPR